MFFVGEEKGLKEEVDLAADGAVFLAIASGRSM